MAQTANPNAVSIWTRILKYRVWIIEFDELDFLSISNSNFAGYTGSKNLVQTRQKFQFVKLDFSNSIFQNLSADRYRVRHILICRERCHYQSYNWFVLGQRCYVCGGSTGRECEEIVARRWSPYVRPRPVLTSDGKRQWEECTDLINNKGCIKQVVNGGK